MAFAGPSDLTQLAQAQPAPAQPVRPHDRARSRGARGRRATAPEEPIGNVATVIGSASVVRNNETTPLKVKDDIYLNDVVQTGAKSALGITFSDATTFNLKANSQITIDSYVYEDGGKQNAGVFDVAKGTVAFVAAAVAKTGDMKITTPTATLGIRGTTGLVEVPEGAAANNPNNVAIKLYPDADGRVGRIEVNDRAGARLGFLNQASSGFAIRPGGGGVRFAAVPLTISPQQMLRDQGFVRQVHSTQNLGRRVFSEQRDFRRANPGFNRINAPRRGPQQNGLPGQNRTGQQPGSPNRPGNRSPVCRTVRDSSSPGSRTVPDNSNCSGRVNRSNCSNRARLTGRDSNCSGRDHRVRRSKPDCRRGRASRRRQRDGRASSRARPRAPQPVRLRKPVVRSASSSPAVRRNCARRPVLRRQAFSNPASGKACGPVACKVRPACCDKACRSGLRRDCAPPTARSRPRRTCGRYLLPS